MYDSIEPNPVTIKVSVRLLPQRTFAVFLIMFAITATAPTAFSQVDQNIGPGGDEGGPIVTEAPSGRYALIQKQVKPRLKSCQGEVVCYQTTVHFQDKSKPDRVLPAVGLSQHVSAQATANYIISPDERWFVRDQQIFQSWTIVVLYKIEADSRVRLVSDKLRDLGLDCVLADLHRKTKEWANISSKDFAHVAAEDVSWSSDSNVIHFCVGARLNVQNPKSKTLGDVMRAVDYNVNTGKTTVHSTNCL
jgi:hypothetical protein